MDPLTVYGAVGLVWLATFLLVRLRRDHRTSLARVARRLGLRHRGDAVVGAIQGVTVVARVTGKTVEGDRVNVRASASWPLPLDLGLALRSLPSPRPERGFDACFTLRADERGRAASLLGEDLRHCLLGEVARGSTVSLSDRGVVVEGAISEHDDTWLPLALSCCAQAARLTRSRASSLPLATPLGPLAARWQQLGRRLGLDLSADSPLRLEGVLQGCRTTLYAVRLARLSYACEIRVALREPLGIGLLIQPAALYDRHDEPLADEVALGDRVFDDEFVVRAEDGKALAEIFDPGLRQHILAVQHQHGPLFFLDDALGMRLKAQGEDEVRLEQTVTLLIELVERIEAHRRGPELRQGPYR